MFEAAALQTLEPAVLAELELHPGGLGEYELMSQLRKAGYLPMLSKSPAPPLQIFQAHFVLHHVLYRLRDRLRADKHGDIEISALNMQLIPYRAGDQAISSHDHLREYYLDLDNLYQTGEQQVCELIASFWNTLNRLDGREQALEVLGLQDPVSDEQIQDAWRRLIMKHHPDRGGDKTRMQELNAAIQILLK